MKRNDNEAQLELELCNFTDLLYSPRACNTPKRKEKLKSHHMTPLNTFQKRGCNFEPSSAPWRKNPSVRHWKLLFTFLEEYASSTPNKLKVIDAYLLYIMMTGALQFLYCLLVGTFPFNSFLSGFISCVGSFILAVCLRIQINPQNKGEFLSISPERAFADFLFAHTVLHLVVINFIG
uniref:Dolichyl-diphosphooligosaccharide--protein glycosyltransferase subunit DAD1 n=1 Tax=Cyprinus carpio carpio TaxID=630221 RepID=A0A8C1E4Y3_CYPCA